MTRHLLPLLLAIAFVAAPALAQDVSTRPEDQIVVAQNERDGSSLFEFAFEVRRVTSDVVDSQNVAIAYASCQSCTTVAISIQILIVTGTPGTVTPTNLALALNENCQDCTTFASAQQFVFGSADRLRLTGQGRSQLRAIRKAFLDLEDAGLTADELALRVDELGQELRRVLTEELRVAGRDDDRGEQGERERDENSEKGEDERDDDPLDEPGTVTTPVEPYDPDAVEDPGATQETTPPAATTPSTQTAPPTETNPAPAETTPTEPAPAQTAPPAQTTPTETAP